MPAEFPTLYDVHRAVRDNQRANPQARQAILDALEPILFSLRDVLSYRRGWSTKDLADKRIVYELGGISDAEKDLILNTLLYQEFTSRIAQGISNASMSLWVCCDEAQRLVSPANPTGGLSDLLSLVRGAGIGVDLAVQNAHVVPSILSNTAVKVIGRCGSASDYDVIGQAMGLTVEERRYLAHKLVPGTFLTQLGEGSWRYPFLCRVPRMEFAHSNLQEEVRIALPHVRTD